MKIIRNNERNEENNNAALHMAIIVSCSFLTIVDIILIFTTMKEIFMVPFVKKWSILESKKTAIMNLRAKLGKIERKKITPYHCFQLKTPVINNNNQNFQKQFTTIFGKHSKSDNTLLKKNNEKKIFYVNSKIIKISSKKKLILNPVEEVKIQGSEIKKIIMNNDMSLQKVHSQKDLKKRFLDKIPGDFLLNEEEDERILDIMIEVGQKKV